MNKKIYALIIITFSPLLYLQANEPIEKTEIVVQAVFGAGFFAQLNRVFSNMIYFYGKNIARFTPDWSDEFFPYKDNPACNGWDLYFELLKTNNSTLEYKKAYSGPMDHIIHDQTCLDRWVNYKNYLPYRKYMNKKLTEYIAIKPAIIQEINQFYDQHMASHFCIGVHVRFSAAHSQENPLGKAIDLYDYITEAQNQLNEHKDENPIIFLCSESNYVITEFQKHFKASQSICTNAFRVAYKEEPHLLFDQGDYYLANPEEFHKKKPGYLGGKTALMDCVLLSKCKIMIHSQSNVCEWATFFNPHIESIFLPKGLLTKPCLYENAPFHLVSKR